MQLNNLKPAWKQLKLLNAMPQIESKEILSTIENAENANKIKLTKSCFEHGHVHCHYNFLSGRMMTYIVWNIDPRIFDEFEFLRLYGVCWALGMLVAYKIMLRIYKSEGISQIELDKLTTYVLLGVIIGARFGHILFYDPVYYWHNPIEILPFRIKPNFEFTGLAGLASHGGVLGALLALYLYNRKFKKDYLWLLDRLMIAGAALGGFIRLGNLMNSEIIGIPSDLPGLLYSPGRPYSKTSGTAL